MFPDPPFRIPLWGTVNVKRALCVQGARCLKLFPDSLNADLRSPATQHFELEPVQ